MDSALVQPAPQPLVARQVLWEVILQLTIIIIIIKFMTSIKVLLLVVYELSINQ